MFTGGKLKQSYTPQRVCVCVSVLTAHISVHLYCHIGASVIYVCLIFLSINPSLHKLNYDLNQLYPSYTNIHGHKCFLF